LIELERSIVETIPGVNLNLEFPIQKTAGSILITPLSEESVALLKRVHGRHSNLSHFCIGLHEDFSAILGKIDLDFLGGPSPRNQQDLALAENLMEHPIAPPERILPLRALRGLGIHSLQAFRRDFPQEPGLEPGSGPSIHPASQCIG
jgi:hypothetical protein